jgi:hypothetical protein
LALSVACTLGFVAVLGVGALVSANDQPDPSPYVTSTTVDPVCATGLPDLMPKMRQFHTDASRVSDEIDSYNSAVEAYNSGQTSTMPDKSTLLSYIGTAISDLQSVESTLQGAISQAQDSSVESDLNDMLTAVQEMEDQYQSYENDPEGSWIDTSSEASALGSAAESLQTHCGG